MKFLEQIRDLIECYIDPEAPLLYAGVFFSVLAGISAIACLISTAIAITIR